MLWLLSHGIEAILKKTVLSPVFIVAVVFILLLERIWPVDPRQKTFSVGFLHDCVWLVLALSFVAIVVNEYVHWFKSFYDAHLSFLTLKQSKYLPQTVSFVIGILGADFLAWFQHWLKHKVPWFWQIHAVHHSQHEINLFTDFRFHFFEYIISRPIVMVPMMALGVDVPTIALFNVFATWQTRFYHANIRSDLGFLRYIFVTPQSHRIHHSVEERHHDRNFGVMFSFWDRLFGTQWETSDEYPTTGIADTDFPVEKKATLQSAILVPLRQLFYPFFVIGSSFVRQNQNVKQP